MAVPFAKLAANLHSNRKIVEAGRNGREVFIWSLLRNAMVDGDGTLPVGDFKPWFLARELMCSEEEARDGFERCVTVVLLSVTGERVMIVGWDDEWSRRPLTDAERAARYRERKKPSRESRTERDESRGSHDGVTSHVGEERREEEKRGEEKDPPNPPSGGTVSRRVRKRVKASEPTDIERATAMQILETLGEYNGVQYTGSQDHIALITSQLRAGRTSLDLRKVAWYCARVLQWADKPEMEHNLRPETLFGPRTITRYLDPALSRYRLQFKTDSDVREEGAA